jgi:PKD repeat protein
MFVDNIGFNNTPNRSTELESPIYNLSPLTNPELVFWYHMFGSDIEDLNVYISTNGGQTYALETTINGQQQTSTSDAWKERVIDLSTYANQNIRIKFESFESTAGFQNAICIDDVELREAPSCPRPLNLNVVSVGSSSASIGFTGGGASNWNLQYGSTNFSLGSGTVLNSSVNPASLSGLSPNTTYDVYVRDSCGLGDVSVWEGPLTFTTACVAVSAPYTENFDGSAFNPGANFNALGTISNCWRRTLGATYFWKAGPPSFTATNTGPQNDNTTGSGGYMFTESSGFSGLTQTDDLESPLIDLSPLTTPELAFFVHMFGSDISALRVYVDNGSGYTLVNTQTGQQQNSGTAAWKEVIVNLAAYANDTVRLKFEGERNPTGFGSNIAIDDVSILEAPSCPKPQNLALVSITLNSATLNWTSGGANNWQFSYGAPNFSPNSGTLVGTSNNPGTLGGLSPNTPYDVYVRDSCAPGDVSAWAGPLSIRTRCLPVPAPYTQNFDGPSFTVGTFVNAGNFPVCWNRPTTTNYQWSSETGSNFGSGPSADHTSGSGKYIFSQAIFAANFQATNEAIVASESIDLSPLNIPEMAFWYHMFGPQIDSLAVYIDNGSSKTRVFGLSGAQQTATTDPWQEAIVNLSAFANDTISVEFRAYRTTSFSNQSEVAIDDLSIYEQPNCPKPQNLTSTGSTAGSVNLSWTTGGAANWRVEYGPIGFTQGNGTVVNATTIPFTVTGLNPSTAYDFYVQDSCGVSDVSFWTGPINARTACAPLAAPMLENFDGTSFVQGQFFFDPGSIDPCWSRSDTINYFWKVNQGTVPINNSGPSADNTTGSGQYLFTLGGFNSNSNTTLTSLQVDLSPLSSPELRFFSHTFGQLINNLSVDIWDGSTWTTELTLTGQNQTAQTDPWSENIVSLQSYLNDTIQVRFVAQRSGTGGLQAAIAIDDFEIRQAPSCPRPSALVSTIATNNTITFNWTTGGAANWQVRYRPAASTGAFTLVNATSNPFTLTGLNPSTTYEIEVRDSCGLNDVSIYSNPLLAATNCGAVTAPFFENFDGPSWVEGTNGLNQNNQIDPCWSRPNANRPNFGANSGGTTSASTGPLQDASGNGKYLYTEYSGSTTGPGEITSPSIFVPNTLQNPKFKFAYHMLGTDIIDLTVSMRVNGGPFSNLVTLTGQQQTFSGAPWLVDSTDISANAGDTLQFRFSGNSSGFTGDIAIDEVRIEGTPVVCAPVNNLSIQNPTPNSLEVSWTTPNTNAIVNVSYYDIAAGPLTATTVSGVGSPYTIPNLLAGTTYVVAVFDSCGLVIATPVLDTLATLTCAPVNNLSVQNPTPNSLEVSWTTPNTNAIVNVSYYDITTGPPSATTVGGVGSPYTIPNLLAGTTYVVAVFDSCGSATATPQLDTLATLPCTAVTANFTSAASFLGVTFSSTASNADSLQWDFAGLGGSTLQNPNFGFPAAGTYTITLRAFNDCGNSDTITQTLTLCDTLRAAFTFATTGDSISYDASSSTNASGYIWDLDEAQTSTLVDPSVKYTTTGQKTVTLTVYNNCGDTLSTTQTIDVCAPPVAQWTYTILPPTNSGLRIQFDGTSSVGAVSYAWDFGDGNTATGPQPIHIYSTPGLFYEVELTVTNACGAISIRKFRLNQISVEEVALDGGLSLFPNPAAAEVNLEWNAQNIEPQSVHIISLNGAMQKEVLINDGKSGLQRINLGGFSTGLYIVRVNHAKGVEQLKLRLL